MRVLVSQQFPEHFHQAQDEKSPLQSRRIQKHFLVPGSLRPSSGIALGHNMPSVFDTASLRCPLANTECGSDDGPHPTSQARRAPSLVV